MDKELEAQIEQKVREILDAELGAKISKAISEGQVESKAAFIASKGNLDSAYMPLILASAAAALEIESAIFFTFYGLDIINKKKNKNLKVAPIANPAMPIPMPNIIGALPGMTAMATLMMKKWMAAQNVPSIQELLEVCMESRVKLIACTMSMDVMGIKKEDLIDGIEFGGAATFLEYASRCNITLLF
ncbi:MAG: DsrE/DsrF/DrsH-like family protein [Deltaproteobacteria bacterium]|nr:DsrE/DsrF/DrsH-like family protein [Deltaproteobacteria bacterium]MBW2081975.1 DsrE/DsrF/DrsH-like family protein [Deltaproteobacteria bacterium]HDM10328.1 peroxiredoxin family protein [Desulfobacteraceae bacterium]